MEEQQTGRVVRVLPDKRVVVDIRGELLTAAAYGIAPRPGKTVLITNTGRNWTVLSWQ